MFIKLLKAKAIILSLILFPYFYTQAATVTWTGTVDTDWNNSLNWNPSQPTSTDDVVIPNGLTNYPVITTLGNTVQSVEIQGVNSVFEINPGAELTILGSPVTGLVNEGVVIILGTLNITNSMGVGLENVGEVAVHVNGILEITGTLGTSAIKNTSDALQFVNMGLINIIGSGSEGLSNNSYFINNHQINIEGSHSGTGLTNNDTFDNFGTIDINTTNLPEGGAILNNDIFINDACSRVIVNRKIDNTLGSFDHSGILILNGMDNNSGTFDNSGIIYNPNSAGLTTNGTGSVYNNLTTNVWTACEGTTNWDTGGNWSLNTEPATNQNVIISDLMEDTIFPSIHTDENTCKSVVVELGAALEIQSEGVLMIANSTANGIYVLGTFTNTGTLSIHNSVADGFRNQALGTSNGGEINITDSGDDAFFNEVNSEFTNFGTINIEGTQDESGIDNRGDFVIDGDITIGTANSPLDGSVVNVSDFEITRCGSLTVNNEIDNVGANYFNNYGAIFSTFNGVNQGTIDNETVIYNLNGGTFTSVPESNGFELTDINITVWNPCTTNTSWTNVRNWTTDVPDNTKDVIVPLISLSFYPIITTTANVDMMTIEAGAEVTNESTLNAQTIDNSGDLINDNCSAIINVSTDLTNNASGVITNLGTINLLEASFTDNGTYEGNPTGVSPPNILYVDKAATTGNDDGTSWEDAFIDLQDALAYAETCPIEIWVAKGGYFPTSTTNRYISFNIPDGVELYGGFNGTEELRNERDFVLYETILSGDIGTYNDDSDNSYQVVVADEEVSVKIDGFSIRDGNANETDSEVPKDTGGGFQNLGEAIVQNCIFENNSADGNGGGGMYNGYLKEDNTKVINCIFRSNSGYAILNVSSDLSIINTLISGNNGGGINHSGSNTTQVLDMDNCTIVGNHGTGVYLDETTLNAANSIFWDNEVDGVQDALAQIDTDNTGNSPTVNFSCIEGGWSGNGSDNISTDPLFTSPIDPTTSPTVSGNFTLQVGSPALNTGDNSSLPIDDTDVDGDEDNTEIIDVDLAYNARIQESTLDMGTYEGAIICAPTNVLFVDIDASGGDDGTSWEDAYTDLQSALTFAASCNIITEIWVAQGTYKPTSNPMAPAAAFVLQNDLGIYGGFSGNGTETLLSERDIVTNITILSGDINNSNTADTGDSYHIVKGDNRNNTALLDGFTIQHAYGSANGAGVTIKNGNAIIRNCIFQDNIAPNQGAAIFLLNSNSLIFNCQFINNDATSGGAVQIESGAPKIIKCTFEGNTAVTGGAINSQGGNPVFTNCILEGNSSTGGGAGMYLGEGSDVTLTNCLFFDQNSNFAGGGIFGINSHITVVNSTFTENSSRANGSTVNPNTGGGIFVNGGSLTVENSIFWDNYTFNNNNAQTTEIASGGGADVSVSNSIWQDNTSGGTVYNINPLFSNSAADYFTLQFCSPAIGIGNNAAIPVDTGDVDEDDNTTEQIDIDLNGDNRISDTNIDLGAYENSDSATPFHIEWIGEASTDWTDPLNWCPNVVPTSADHVIIGNVDAPNYPIIDSNIGTIQSLEIKDGSIAISQTGTISLNNSTAHGIVIIKGTITNNGNLFISNTELDGMLVTGSANFHNNEGAILDINGAGENGISRHGISNVFNVGEIIISQFSPDKKMLAPTSILVEAGAGAIYNLQCASITFDDVLENNGTIVTDGFIHANGNTFTNTGTFIQGNTGIIFDPNDIFASPGGSFVNQGTILNESQASSNTNIWTGCADDFDWDTADNWSLETEPLAIHDVIIPNVGESSNYPIINTIGNVAQSIEILSDASLTLNSSGGLTIDGGDNGITVKSNAFLEIYGSLMIENSTNNGMVNQGTIINEGFLNILNSTTSDINNTGIFTLSLCSETNLTGQIISNNTFTNNGLLTTSFNGTNTISGTFTNNKVINDQFDSFNGGTDITNNDIIIIPITGCIGGTISNALIGSSTDLSIEEDWFLYNEISEESEDAGDYNVESNTFTPDNEVLEEGTYTLNVTILDNSNECDILTSIEVTIENCVPNFFWTGGSDPVNTNWSDSDNWTNGIVPDYGDIATIPDISDLDNYPIIDEFIEIGGLIIEDNASLTLADGGELLTSFNNTGIDIGEEASLTIEEGGVAFINAFTTGIHIEGTLSVSGKLFVTSGGTGINVAPTGTVNDNGFIQINQGFSGGEPEKAGLISVVNFLEIQNGSTFEVTAGDTLLIDGSIANPEKKSGLADGDIGIKVFDGGTFTSEDLGVTQVINITGTGIDNGGEVNNSGEMMVTAETTGITNSNTFTNDGSISISKPEIISGFKKTGAATVVNFLEIQNGSTFGMLSDGSLIIDGEDVGPSKKSGVVNDDTGIDVNDGGTFTSETNTTIQIINMNGLSTGIVTNGTIDNAGDMSITVESTGIQVQSGITENSGEIIISKIEGLALAAKKAGGASVVNFLEIQNGSTFGVLSGGSLLINGEEAGTGLVKALVNDTGIEVNSGGTFFTESNSDVDVINMIGASIGVSTSGTVNNDGDFNITTEGKGMEVQAGSVNNGGDLTISKIEGLTLATKQSGGASVVNFLEIQNGSTFGVLSGGSLLVNGQSTLVAKANSFSNDTGIDVQTGGYFFSESNSTVDVINMIGSSTGVVNSGDILDNGDFTITTENIGMQVQSNNVEVGGTLTITVIDAPVKSISKTSGASVVNFLEIQNGSTFEILQGGQVVVDGLVGAAKKLTNDTGVTINSGGELITNNEANLQIKNIVGQGTGMRNEGVVNNDGTIDIQEIGGNSLENTNDFNNNDCSVFSTDSKVMNTASGDFMNEGLISSTYGSNGGQHENDGMFVNEGIIEDPNDAFVNIIGNPVIEVGDGNVTNYTLFTPLFTCYGEVINNATNKPLDTDGVYNVNMWYSDISLTQEAGVFEYSETFGINRFTPDYNLLGPGVHLLYVSVTSDNFVDCGARNVVLVQLIIYPLPEIVPIDQTICTGDALTTPLAVEDNGWNYSWYDQESDGNLLTTGITYTPDPLPTTTTTYWVEATNTTNNCESDGRTAVTLTVYDYPAIPNITSSTELIDCVNTTTLDAGEYPANHTYLWSSSETTQSIVVTNLETYTVTITNEGICNSSASIEVTEDVSFNINISGDTNYCLEGNVELDAGSYSNNDTYIWSNTATTQTISATFGSYTVTVTNADGCIDVDETEIVEFCCEATAGTLSIVNSDICAGEEFVFTTNDTHQTSADYTLHYLLVDDFTGIIEFVSMDGVFAGIPPDGYEVYSYVQYSSNPPIPSPVINSNLLVSDIGTTNMGCFDLSAPQNIIVPDFPDLTSTFSTTQGAVSLTFIANLTITGGTPPYSVEFTNKQGLVTLQQLLITQYVVQYPEGSSWELSITDDNGCESPNWKIGSADNPNVLITDVLITKESCINEQDGAINITVTGGTPCIPSPSYTYNWSGPNSFTATTQDISDLSSGTYHVTITDCDNGSFANNYNVQRKPPRRGRGRGRAIGCNPVSSTKTPAEYSDEPFLEVYPNPFNYYTTIDFGTTETSIVNISLYTLDGRKITEVYQNLTEKETTHRIHFEAENIQTGMYLLQLRTESGGMVMKKLMVK